MEEVLTPKRKPGRPKKNERKVTGIAHRVPVSGDRDILTVSGLDHQKYYYRWVRDVNEAGSRIFTFLRAGYAFVSADNIEVGQDFVFRTAQTGSIVRSPAGRTGDFLYLMYLDRELYESDQNHKFDSIDNTEEEMARERDDRTDELYGSGKLSVSYTRTVKTSLDED